MPKFEDLTGQRFGHLTAIKPLGGNKWIWKCDCGCEKEILAASVKRGKTSACGTSCEFSPSHKLTSDLTGKRFGRLTVIERAKRYKTNSGKRGTYYVCQCDCGNIVTVIANHLTTGHTQSCGCAHTEQTEVWKTFNLSHGRSRESAKSKSYARWMQIKQRCYNPNDIDYKYYGARGIKMWDGWVNNPTAFCEYVEALDNYADANTTIDRIDPNKDYEPNNLRWITLAEQQRNKRSNVRITAFGETKILAEWAREFGLTGTTIQNRISRGWSAEQAISTPTNCQRRITTTDGGIRVD